MAYRPEHSTDRWGESERETRGGGLNCMSAKFIMSPLGAVKWEQWPITAKKVFYWEYADILPRGDGIGEGVWPNVCVCVLVHMSGCMCYVCILALLLAFLPLLENVCSMLTCVCTSENVCQGTNQIFNYSLRYRALILWFFKSVINTAHIWWSTEIVYSLTCNFTTMFLDTCNINFTIWIW